MIDRPPTEALRLGSADILREGLVRMLVEGEEEWLKDWRDLLVAMAPYHDCASRLRLDPARLFEDVSSDAPPALADVVRRFGRRADVTPSAFGFELTELPEGPAYEWPDVDYDEIRELEVWLSDESEAGEN